ncbi:MAG: beta-ketoacyl synthase N-terminal-like domain-containing protein [Nitrososphaerales archaeon]
MAKVIVASVGYTRVGDHWDKSILDLAVEASKKALKPYPNIRPEVIIVGNMFSSQSSRQEHLGALLASALNLTRTPAFKVEAACASGGVAFNIAYNKIRSGEVSSALVVGVEKMRDLDTPEASLALSMAESAEYTQFIGASFLSLNAMLARLYSETYNVSRDELSAFPVIAHSNAATAEHAQFRKAISVEDVSRSPLVSDPLRLLDCAPVGDGAAAVLLASDAFDEDDGARVDVLSSKISTNIFSIYERDDMLKFDATRDAASKAFSEAGISVEDVDVLEVHDAFSVTAALSVEAMGFSREGEGAKDAAKGIYALRGRYPALTFGGLKGRGHPVGATGIYQIIELWLQLKGRGNANQVKGCRIGVAQNIGGVDTTSVVSVLARR